MITIGTLALGIFVTTPTMKTGALWAPVLPSVMMSLETQRETRN